MKQEKSRNLHLLWDEKITPGIIDNFESVLPGQNDYIYWWNPYFKLHFAKEDDKCKVIKNDKDIPDLDYSRYSKIIIHGLDPKKVKFCAQNIPPHIPIYWVLWGIELYRLLENRGFDLFYRKNSKVSFIDKLKKTIIRLGYLSPQMREYLSILRERNVTMVCSREEYNLLRHYYPKQTRTLKNNPDFFYYPVEKILGPLANEKVKGNTIIIGNSNSETNNHSYAFKFLRKADLSGKSILVPLNYGGNDESRHSTIQEGIALWGENFKPLTEFLPLDEYNRLLLEAEYAVYGNWRQEAVGNILVLFYLGSKIFLSHRNPLLKMFRDMGLILFELEKIDEDSFQTPLNYEQKLINRKIISEKYSFAKMQENIKKLFQ
ncbi:MAG: TDP-N-acetylfucosamine:lipid II N-acetylfucosaminyltransferase [Bacteroidales bacterium]|nr:TDP-N-acetylfucosamine:lipid II N-acetylfucosaminyltransferase [Bacteroidales bacterium]